MTSLHLKMSFFDPYLTPGDKMKILKPYCTSTRHAQWDPRVSFVYYLKYFVWNLDGVQVRSLIRQKTSFFHPHMTPGGKMKIPNPYCTSTRHVQSYPRVLIIYFWKCRCSLSDKLHRKKEKSFFDPRLTPRDKMKIPKPYCASTGHGQSSPRIS